MSRNGIRRMRPLRAVVLAALALAPGAVARAEEPPPEPGPEAWSALERLAGDWEGEITGRLGTGTAIRRYDLLRKGKFLGMRHHSIRLPQEKSPQGDEHEELSVFSYDAESERIVLREFMIHEGLVVESTCDASGQGATRIVCLSERVEGGPGIRARLTLEIQDRYRFTETYELAWPGKEFEHYFTNHWTRTPKPHAWR